PPCARPHLMDTALCTLCLPVRHPGTYPFGENPMRTPIITAALSALAACNSPLERQAPMADSVAVAERAGFAQTARVDRVARAAAPLVAQQRAVAAASDVPLFSRSRRARRRSEEHTSELQSPDHLVC